MNNIIQIGCSSFYNWSWKKIFYPEDIPGSKWFEYYCSHFDTFEINSTFYKFPTAKVMENWYNRTPEGFVFSVKIPKEITHQKKLIDSQDLITKFYSICKNGLKQKLGPILFQFPPSYQYDSEKLQFIIRQLNLEFENIIEFRHPSWWIAEVWEELAKNNISFCSVSHPKLPEILVTIAPIIYVRLHGRPKMFYSSYTNEDLSTKIDLISQSNKPKAYLYFNNTASSSGILNALEAKRLLL